MNTTSVDAYLRDGCGRCDKYQTPACKVHLWTKPLEALRALVKATGLVEEMKWGSPCYTLGGKNVVMLVSLKEYCAIQFFKGSLLEDPEALLESPGPNSQHVRLLKLRSAADITKHRAAVKRFLAQAIELEGAGVTVKKKPAASLELPEELARRLAAEPALGKAFEALTPGRQRSHVLHIAGAKQPETRERRVDRCAEDILAGRGFNER
ncbi:MAG: YdeI/OmpD-associated family protein [Myxococcota bacterium]